tara:strand:+ start:357 stop:527 length:171 start_codon:yes stop_codon:yes gene_type:complete
MSFWLQSLSENGFDVFTLVYIAVLLIIYHYLMRWYISNQLNEIKEMLLEIYDEVEK